MTTFRTQTQVSLRSLCAYFVRQTEPKILRLVYGHFIFPCTNCSGSFMFCSECEQLTHTVFCDLVKLASGQQLKHINQCQLSFNSMHNYIYIVGKLKKSHKSIRISK